MSLMSTLAKVAIGYAAARGVDKLSGGGLKELLGGGAQVKASDPVAAGQAQMAEGLSGQANPLNAMMEKMGGGMDMSAMMGALGGGAGGNPMADMVEKMQKASGIDFSGFMGGLNGAATAGAGADKSGLLSALPEGGAGLAGVLAAAGGAAAMGGKSVESLLDQFGEDSAVPKPEATAALMLRAMIQAAKADGSIDEAEKLRIINTLGDDAEASDLAFVEDQLNSPIDVAGLASDTPEAMRAQVYASSLMTIRVDTAAEAQYLDLLAKAMELPEPVVNTLHLQMGNKPLYA